MFSVNFYRNLKNEIEQLKINEQKWKALYEKEKIIMESLQLSIKPRPKTPKKKRKSVCIQTEEEKPKPTSPTEQYTQNFIHKLDEITDKDLPTTMTQKLKELMKLSLEEKKLSKLSEENEEDTDDIVFRYVPKDTPPKPKKTRQFVVPKTPRFTPELEKLHVTAQGLSQPHRKDEQKAEQTDIDKTLYCRFIPAIQLNDPVQTTSQINLSSSKLTPRSTPRRTTPRSGRSTPMTTTDVKLFEFMTRPPIEKWRKRREQIIKERMENMKKILKWYAILLVLTKLVFIG